MVNAALRKSVGPARHKPTEAAARLCTKSAACSCRQPASNDTTFGSLLREAAVVSYSVRSELCNRAQSHNWVAGFARGRGRQVLIREMDNVMQVIEEAKKRGQEKAKKTKSMIVMDVKPWDDTTGEPVPSPLGGSYHGNAKIMIVLGFIARLRIVQTSGCPVLA